MPRSAISPAGRIVNFFRTADLDSATLILGLCKDAVAERQQRSVDAKARAVKGPPIRKARKRTLKTK